jgi:hypothetical protein
MGTCYWLITDDESELYELGKVWAHWPEIWPEIFGAGKAMRAADLGADGGWRCAR